MVLSLYVMPLTGDGTKANPRRPKYKDSLFPSIAWSMYDYGDEPWCLVGIDDVPPATDTALNANSDVFELPANLDQTMGSVGVRNTVRNRLEAVNIPGTWVQTSTTYRDVVEFIGGICQFAQRFQGISGIPANRWFAGSRSLDSTIGDLAVPARQALASTSDSFGFDRSSVTNSTTLRVALQSAAGQYVTAQMPLIMSGVSLYNA